MNTLKQVRKPFSTVNQRPAKNMAYNYDDMESFFSFLDDSLNPVSFGKVNRNEPCPCGSGKKYKHCCGKGN